MAKKRNGRFIRVENPDNLFELGADDVNYSDFYE